MYASSYFITKVHDGGAFQVVITGCTERYLFRNLRTALLFADKNCGAGSFGILTNC